VREEKYKNPFPLYLQYKQLTCESKQENMGLLAEGEMLTWPETKALAEHVRKHGIQQFINLHKKFKLRKNDPLKWGDEVEYTIVKFDHEKKTARASICANELVNKLQEKELSGYPNLVAQWKPECGNYMIEGVPGIAFLLIDSSKVIVTNRISILWTSRRLVESRAKYEDEERGVAVIFG